MVNFGFVLFPLYIYPGQGGWQQLFTAASANPSLTFQVVINVDSGPGSGSCPDANYIDALGTLNSFSNIQTLGYVHTASRYDCGSSGTDICPGTQPLSALQSNISTYQNWPSAGCTTKDIHIGGIFFDEAPTTASGIDYMQNITDYARNTLTRGPKTILFNAGDAVDQGYWSIADYINVFEDTEAAYDAADIGGLDVGGTRSQQTTLIIHSYTDDGTVEARDITTIMSVQNDAMAGLFITDIPASQNPYGSFPTAWTQFCANMSKVVSRNAAGR